MSPAGADANAVGAGYTALHSAILRGDGELVKALLARGANPNAPLQKGTIVLRSAYQWILPKIYVGLTPFQLASRCSAVSCRQGRQARREEQGGADSDGSAAEAGRHGSAVTRLR